MSASHVAHSTTISEVVRRPGTAPGVEVEVVVLTCEPGTDTVEIAVHGATVISWKSSGDEMLFLSPQTVFDNSKAIRGGIPVVFPNFGPWELGPNHGFARIRSWAVKDTGMADDGSSFATFVLEDDEETRQMWHGNRFRLEYTVSLLPGKLTTSLSVHNTATEGQFDFTALLHTYLRVPDIASVAIEGLAGATYIDKLKDSQQSKEEREAIKFAENVDSIYVSVPGPHTVRNVASSRPTEKFDHSSSNPVVDMEVHKANLPDTVVWNPWIEKARAMGDLNDDGYKTFVCVEPGAVADRVVLPAGGTWVGSQTLIRKAHR